MHRDGLTAISWDTAARRCREGKSAKAWIEKNEKKKTQIFRGSFSGVSMPPIATAGAFSAFSEIYKICIFLHRSDLNFKNLRLR